MSDKRKVAVIMGGRSSEHEVSLVSAANVVRCIDTDENEIILIGITKEGEWKLIDSLEAVEDGSWTEGETRAIISPETGKGELFLIRDGQMTSRKIDVVFPVLHGMNGEDGTIQGIFDLAQIPYVGCGLLASACSMDKFYTKIIVDHIGIRQAPFVGVRRKELDRMDEVVKRVEDVFSYPVFVKPSKAGSSQGVSKADDRQELIDALELAGQHDSKILVEEMIRGREIECAVLGGLVPEASGVGEILPADEFYSYDAKYNNAESMTVVGPDLPEEKTEEIRQAACDIFTALDGYGLSRVDFFLRDEDQAVIFNEINTMPGFTAISMFPMLWEAEGVSKKELVKKLIDLAVERFDA